MHRRKRNREKKTTTVSKHFLVRCVQRLGYLPDEKDLVRKIQRAELEFFERQSNRVTVWKWECPRTGIACLLPYDKERKQIITILFENAEDYLKNNEVVYGDYV